MTYTRRFHQIPVPSGPKTTKQINHNLNQHQQQTHKIPAPPRPRARRRGRLPQGLRAAASPAVAAAAGVFHVFLEGQSPVGREIHSETPRPLFPGGLTPFSGGTTCLKLLV